LVDPPIQITTPRAITVTSTQIQYSQTEVLSFNGLLWPHVSVATLVPADPLSAAAAAATVMISPSATSGLGWKHGMRQWVRKVATRLASKRWPRAVVRPGD